MRGVPIVVGLCLAMALLGGTNHPAPFQQPSSLTPLPGRTIPTPQPLGIPTVEATIILADPSLDTVAQAAQTEGLTELQQIARLAFHGLRLVNVHNDLIQILTTPPYNAVLVDQAYRAQNSVTVRIQSIHISQIQALAGVLSVQVGRAPEIPSQPTEIPRQERTPGTRLPPLQPPGLD